jgi:threonylcarbamoyladenosine tRNA methylthiotransferase MtaB
MFKFKIYTLGCKVNQYDSATLRRKLKEAGGEYLKTVAPTPADLVIVNTCTVTTTAHRKDRRMIKKAKQENPGAKVVVMGCWLKVYPEVKKKIQADLYWPVGRLDALTTEISKIFSKKRKNRQNGYSQDGTDKEEGENKPTLLPPRKGERARYFMKVQEGCEQFCSYCVIPYSRGKLTSRSVREVIEEARVVEKVGYEELVLCGIHLGLYNQEINSESRVEDLTFLIKQIIKNTKKLRIRLSSIEVNDIGKNLIDLMKKEERFCNHLHIPLQGGDDEILRLMNRPYDREYFRGKIKAIRRAVPAVAITSDVIVGFPGETEEQFQNTYDFIAKLQLSKLHIFPYSSHPRTAAAKMDGHLPNSVKKKRADKLRRLSEELWQKYQWTMKGKFDKFKVLVEAIQAGEAVGKTEYYFNLPITGIGLGRLEIGKIVEVEKVSDDTRDSWRVV